MKAGLETSWDVRDVIDLLSLSTVSNNRFRSRRSEINEHGRVYGGQLLGQALAAATKTVDADRPATYLQFLFAAGGLPEQPIDYDVSLLQDGKRFSSRNVRGVQANERTICDASISFAKAIEAPARQEPAPDDCGLKLNPEGLPSLEDIKAPEAREVERTLDYGFHSHGAIDFRIPYVKDLLGADSQEPRMRFFVRIRRTLPDDDRLHACAFAYLSDYWINFVACIPHVRALTTTGTRLYVASLNHAIWFHRPLRADQWLLFDCRNPSGASGRGLSVARIYAQSGELVATAAQECLLAPVS
jgi:acyl-CoA thioesterase-2